MLLWATFDQNSNITRVKITNSAVGGNAGKTGLSNASTGLIISTISDSEATATTYTVAGSTVETIATLGTYAAPTATKCRFKEVDATNHPGIYELQFADARFSVASSKSLLLSISGATGAAQCDAVIPLPVIDLFAAAIPANVTQLLGTAWLTPAVAGTPDVNTIAGAVNTIVDAVWDEPLTGATHNVATSSGRRLRVLGAVSVFDGTASAGGADTITLAGGSATNAIYVGCLVALDGGTGVGQARYIVAYDGTSKVATVARAWTTAPDATSTFNIFADNQVFFIVFGTASAGGASSITLDATASAVTDIYNGLAIRILAGTGDDQIRVITAYNGGTKVATVDRAWTTVPGATSVYGVCAFGPGSLSGSIGSLATQAKADVNAEVVDALATDTYAEPGQELPAATNTIAKKLSYVFKAWRNKVTQDATDYKLYADDTTTVDQKATVTDAAGTFTRNEVASGP